RGLITRDRPRVEPWPRRPFRNAGVPPALFQLQFRRAHRAQPRQTASLGGTLRHLLRYISLGRLAAPICAPEVRIRAEEHYRNRESFRPSFVVIRKNSTRRTLQRADRTEARYRRGWLPSRKRRRCCSSH